MSNTMVLIVATLVPTLLFGGLVGGCASWSRAPAHHTASAPLPAGGVVADDAELNALFEADQADRTPGTAPSDWQVVEKNDIARQARVRELLDGGAVRTGRDYYHAGMVFQHADGADGVQLAHELAMIGACLGDMNARWLAAASYDRLLMDLKRPQRFGTQYRSDSQGVLRLYEVSKGVTDSMRAAMRTPSLQEAEAREKQMQVQLDELAKNMKAGSAEK